MDDSRKTRAEILGEMVALRAAVARLQTRAASRQMETEAALRESEKRFRTLVESNLIGMIFADIRGSIKDANDAFLQMVGYSRDDLPLRWDQMTPAEWLPLDLEKIEELRTRGVARLWKKEYFRKDGSRVPILLGVTGLDEATGECVCFVLDITERTRTEEALRRSERLASIGTFAAGIAHEINNPVGGIHLAAEFALNYGHELVEGGMVRRVLEDIKTDAERCGQIVKAILQFARHESSEKSPQDLNEVAQAAADLTRRYAGEQGATITLEVEPLPQVLINTTEMRQVLVNLLRNAIESGDQGVQVQLRTWNHQGQVCLAVQDNGRGISEEQRGHLFDPFFTTRREKGGTGLGLSLVHGILTDHGGSIEVMSSPGRGATFVLHMPAITSISDGTVHEDLRSRRRKTLS